MLADSEQPKFEFHYGGTIMWAEMHRASGGDKATWRASRQGCWQEIQSKRGKGKWAGWKEM